MSEIICTNRIELDAALTKASTDSTIRVVIKSPANIWLASRGSSHVVARESSHVEAWESSHVVARDSSHVVALGSSHVVARGSSHVVARDSSHVVAWESSHVEAWESSHVVASKFVSIHKHSKTSRVKGGVIIEVVYPKTVREWCAFYGVEMNPRTKEIVLFKAVGDDFKSPRGMAYTPGTLPEAPDWDGGIKECGGGLHFSPHPAMALEFNPRAKRFVACPVALKDIVVHKDADYPQKVKARRVCGPIFEVNEYGERI